MSEDMQIGQIGWIDMTVVDAEAIKDFYQTVVGFDVEAVAMSGYSDYVMKTSAGSGVAGICHARGVNADIPPGWLIYITVADVAASAERCVAAGGKVRVTPRGLAGGQFCVIEDPSGAVAGLYQPPETA